MLVELDLSPAQQVSKKYNTNTRLKLIEQRADTCLSDCSRSDG